MLGFAIAVITTLLSFPSVTAGGPMGRLLVILDPGHGGEDTGAIAQGHDSQVFEKDITLAIARHAKRVLEARGIPVVLTRSDDHFIALDRRTEIANAASRDGRTAIFVSIHANSSDEPSSSGAETYVLNAATNEASRRLADLENGRRWAQSHATLDLILSDLASTANYTDSVELACAVQRSVVRGVKQASSQGLRDRGIRQALFYVLMQTHMPGILFEPGFVSNPRDLARLTNPAYQLRLARSLADGVVRWRMHARGQQLASNGGVRHTKFSGIDKSCVPRKN